MRSPAAARVLFVDGGAQRSLSGGAIVPLVFLLALSPLAATGDTISLFFEPECSKCSVTLAPGAETTLYVNAVRNGPLSEYPLVFAEFRVTGLPSDWEVTWTPNPEAFLAFGHPFGVGTQISFDTNPQLGECISLVTCRITATSPASDVYLTVDHHETEPNFWCFPPAPLIVCEPGRGGPPECILCLRDNPQAIINGPECSVAVRSVHWSGIKNLYR